jgi:uncharacterized protein (DUF1800 family)
MDPIGIAFERFDADGRARAQDGGKPIDASGAITTAAGDTIRFADGIELMDSLARHPAVNRCFVRKLFHYAFGREPQAADQCALAQLEKRFSDSSDQGGLDGDVRALVAELVTHDTFLLRRTP